jgi:hypothetical protein
LDKSKWFDIKLLVDLNGAFFQKSMNNCSYTETIKLVLLFLGIGAMHLLHLGRSLSANNLEMLEEEESLAIQTMGY